MVPVTILAIFGKFHAILFAAGALFQQKQLNPGTAFAFTVEMAHFFAATLIVFLGIQSFEAQAQSIQINPNLKEQSFSSNIFVPFIYNFRTNEIHWVIGYGSLSPDGSSHPLAASYRQGVHSEILRELNPKEHRDWGGGAFVYDSLTKKLMLNPTASVWSIGMNSDRWTALGSSYGLLPWQYLDVAMISATKKMKIDFQPFNEALDIEVVLESLKKHRAFPTQLNEAGQKAIAEFLILAAEDPKVILHNSKHSYCTKLLESLDESHPTTTPAVMGRGRLGSMVLGE